MIVAAQSEMQAKLSSAVSGWEQGRRTFRLLEAGGGSLSRIPTTLTPHVTVVDISAEQLERNEADEKILGDLHLVDLGIRKFDMVVAWDVLEHLRDPARVVDKLAAAVDKGGLLVLASPNRYSLQVVLTRATPRAFHVWVYRNIFGKPHAGEPGRAPFPVVHHSDIETDRLRELVTAQGMSVVFECSYERSKRAKLKGRYPALGKLYDLVALIGSRLTRRNMLESDFVMVFQRPGSTAGS